MAFYIVSKMEDLLFSEKKCTNTWNESSCTSINKCPSLRDDRDDRYAFYGKSQEEN